MNNTKLFDYVKNLWDRLEYAEEVYGMDDAFCRLERARWLGAFNAMKAAGFEEEYRKYLISKIKEENE